MRLFLLCAVAAACAAAHDASSEEAEKNQETDTDKELTNEEREAKYKQQDALKLPGQWAIYRQLQAEREEEDKRIEQALADLDAPNQT